MKNLQKGFTLIELLVVVAIIGILSTVVLSSLGNARTKAKESKAMASFGQIRAQGEIYFDNNSSSYATMCSDSAVLGMANQGTVALGGTAIAAPIPATVTAATGLTTCNATATAYAAQIQLSANKWYCVDSAGTAASRNTVYNISAQTCA